jgi:HD-GYP domain-containing protein (c-di-GMP phosphodiesterase class II)
LYQAAALHDPDTAGHVGRVALLAGLMAELADKPQSFSEALQMASPPHDIGKMGTPDHILHKPGRHTPEEWTIMQKHAGHGYQILTGIPGLEMAAEIALNHHHRYNGDPGGYPGRVYGNKIPESAQFFPLADIYDALRSERPYKPAFPHEQAVEIITVGDGRTKPVHFNPQIVDVFKTHHHVIEQFYEQMQNGEIGLELTKDNLLIVRGQHKQHKIQFALPVEQSTADSVRNLADIQARLVAFRSKKTQPTRSRLPASPENEARRTKLNTHYEAKRALSA